MAEDRWNVTKLKAVFFDVDDTLYSTSEFAQRARSNSLDSLISMGLKAKKEELQRELDEVIREFTSNYEHHFDQLLMRLPERLKGDVNPALLTASAVVAYHDTKFSELVAYEDVLDVLRVLAQTDLVLGVITDGPVIKQAEKLIRLGVLPYLHARGIFITHQMGYSKTNVKLYERVCREFELRPETVMYVGDNPINDVDPPNAVGMVTVRCRRGGKYSELSGNTQAVHEIHNFYDLLELLKTQYGVGVPPEAGDRPAGDASY